MTSPLSPVALRFVLAIGYKGEPLSLGAGLHAAGLPSQASGRVLRESVDAGLVEAIRHEGGVHVRLTPSGAALALDHRNRAALAHRGAA